MFIFRLSEIFPSPSYKKGHRQRVKEKESPHVWMHTHFRNAGSLKPLTLHKDRDEKGVGDGSISC